MELQNGMVERNAGLPPERRIEFRIGIHLGDVVEESDGDLMGNGVNIAARLEGIADPGGICISEDAYRQVRDKIEIEFGDLGDKELKNIARPVRVYRVRPSIESAPPAAFPHSAALPLPDKPSIAVFNRLQPTSSADFALPRLKAGAPPSHRSRPTRKRKRNH
jgi:adenylate cyclase